MEHVTFTSSEGVDENPSVIRRIADENIVVSVTAGNIPGVPLSMGVTADNLIALDGSDQTCAWNLSNDQQLLLDKFGGRTGVGATDVVVYYVNKLADKKLGKLNGCAGHRPGAAALAVSTVASPWTLAHELGHVLGLQHSTDSINIMFTPTNNITAPIPGFTAEQARTVRASPFCAEI